jgi:large subunit ribosomal protein L18
MINNKMKFARRKQRVRTRLARLTETGKGRLRLSIHRSGVHIYAQVIDDTKDITVATASTLDKDLRKTLKSTCNREAATAVGALVAKRAVEKGVKQVAFDRSGYMYHGRVKALAEAAREGGLEF